MIAGEFERQFSNGGERVKLSFGAGTAIRDFIYGDGNVEGWPAEADGGGHALLAPLDPKRDLNDPAVWSITAAIDGSPGSEEPVSTGSLYADWRIERFPDSAEQANEAISGPEGDPDGDGWVNWMEYALATDPRTEDEVMTRIDLSAPGAVRMTHGFREGLDLEWSYEGSTDLAVWVPMTPIAEVVRGDTREVEFGRDDVPRFLRVRVGYRPEAAR